MKVGQKVVCVDVSPNPFWGDKSGALILNQTYTAKEVHGNVGIILVEVSAPAPYFGFAQSRFRPLEEEKGEMFIEEFITIGEIQ